MGIYVGVNGTSKELSTVYVGVNGTLKECSDVYVGIDGGKKLSYSNTKPGEVVFTSSTIFTIPKKVHKIDCFAVGGGADGGERFSQYKVIRTSVNPAYTAALRNKLESEEYKNICYRKYLEAYDEYNSLAGSGDLKRIEMAAAKLNNVADTYNAAVDQYNKDSDILDSTPQFIKTYGFEYSGGGGGGAGYTAKAIGVNVNPGEIINIIVGDRGHTAGTSIIANKSSIISANGGNYAGASTTGQDGGSGGGGGCVNLDSAYVCENNGGVDGSDGVLGGKGQGTTTRYFGESTGTLYSTGGNGTSYSIEYGGAKSFNTGDGGDSNSGKGGSGVCIIRWTKDYIY